MMAIAHEAHSSDDEDLVMPTDPMDMLVSEEGIWVDSNYQGLMKTWRGLKGLCRAFLPEQEGVLADANFRVFASFVYRWTAAGDSDSEESDGDDIIPETVPDVPQQAQAPEEPDAPSTQSQ